MNESLGFRPVEPLSDREQEILELLAEGLTNREIATRLFLSYETIKWYNKQIYAKLGVSNRTQAAACALEHNLLEREVASSGAGLALQSARLPAQITTFVGRQEHLSKIKAFIRDGIARLVTLTGPGGIGKTRLAIRAAESLSAEFHDGCYFVNLSSTRQPERIAETIASTLKVDRRAHEKSSGALVKHFKHRQVLLVLDNFEHLIEGATLLLDLMSKAPDLVILVTSREALGVYGEMNYPVPPLALPDPSRLAAEGDVPPSEAVELFTQRVLTARPQFQSDRQQSLAVAEICIQLEGLPLAIELAAASLKSISLDELRERLNQSFSKLMPGPRGLPERQRTLEATIAWSYELLSDQEKKLFAPLSVFRGSFTAEAVLSVIESDAATDIQAGLEALRSKNLLYRQHEPRQTNRYAMLEIIREFAENISADLGTLESSRLRHARFYTRFSESAGSKLAGIEQVTWLERLESEYENIRAALEWTLSGPEHELGFRLIAAMCDYWYYQGRSTDALHWVELALAGLAAAAASLRAGVLNCAGHVYMHHGQSERARELLDRSLAIYQDLGDQRNAAWSMVSLGFTWVGQKQHYQEAIAHCEKGLTLFRELGDQRGTMAALTIKGRLCWIQGDHEKAEQAYQQALELSRTTGNRLRESILYANLAMLEHSLENPGRAREYSRRCIQLSWEIGIHHMTALGLAALAGPLSEQGSSAVAARLLGASEAFRQASHTTPEATDQSYLDRIFASVNNRLGEQAFESAFAEGRAMTLRDAVAYALGDLTT